MKIALESDQYYRFYADVGSYRYSFNGQEQDNEVNDATGTSLTAEYWQYDSRLGRRWNLDPVKKDDVSPYLVMGNIPTIYKDPNGDDWFRDLDGNVRWDDSRAGDITYQDRTWTNIGSTLTVRTTSFIPGVWQGGNDVPVGNAEGDKLTTIVKITGNYDQSGAFTGYTYSYTEIIGNTFNNAYFPGETVPGSRNMNFAFTSNAGYYNVFVERHVQANFKEKWTLDAMGSAVDVGQKMCMGVAPDGSFFMNLGHGVYPSVNVEIDGVGTYYQYAAQSFIYSHAPNLLTIGTSTWGVLAAAQQATSDNLNEQYRKANKANFIGFTSAPFGWEYSRLDWKKH